MNEFTRRLYEELFRAKQGMASDDDVLERPNLDLTNRPRVHNPDGSISTIRSLGVNFGDGEMLIPTVIPDGDSWRVGSNDEAIQHFLRTGRHLGKYKSVDASDQWGSRLHDEQEQMGMSPVERFRFRWDPQ